LYTAGSIIWWYSRTELYALIQFRERAKGVIKYKGVRNLMW